jgi:hypothetical protein
MYLLLLVIIILLACVMMRPGAVTLGSISNANLVPNAALSRRETVQLTGQPTAPGTPTTPGGTSGQPTMSTQRSSMRTTAYPLSRYPHTVTRRKVMDDTGDIIPVRVARTAKKVSWAPVRQERVVTPTTITDTVGGV